MAVKGTTCIKGLPAQYVFFLFAVLMLYVAILFAGVDKNSYHTGTVEAH